MFESMDDKPLPPVNLYIWGAAYRAIKYNQLFATALNISSSRAPLGLTECMTPTKVDLNLPSLPYHSIEVKCCVDLFLMLCRLMHWRKT